MCGCVTNNQPIQSPLLGKKDIKRNPFRIEVRRVEDLPTSEEINKFIQSQPPGDGSSAWGVFSSLNFKTSKQVAELLKQKNVRSEINQYFTYHLCVEAINEERAKNILDGKKIVGYQIEDPNKWESICSSSHILIKSLFDQGAILASKNISVQIYATARFSINIRPDDYTKAIKILKELEEAKEITTSESDVICEKDTGWGFRPYSPSRPVFNVEKGKPLWSSFPEGESAFVPDQKEK